MPEVIYTPFVEEEGFTFGSLQTRLDTAKDAINGTIQQASQRGALNENHIGSSVVFMDTKEITTPNTHTATFGGAGPVYWNNTNGSGSGLGRQDPPPADGIWEPIGPGVDPLEIGFSPIPLMAADPDDRQGVTCIYVLLNAEVKYVSGEEQGSPFNVDAGVAVTVMINGFRGNTDFGWFHIYQNQTPEAAPIWARLPERKVGSRYAGASDPHLNAWHDISIRTTIRGEDLERLQVISGLPIESVGGVRGAFSLITSTIAPTTTVEFRNANLTVMALRGTEV